MKRKTNIFAISIVALSLAFTGCTSYQYLGRSTDIEKKQITGAPVYCDLNIDFSKKIEVESEKQPTAELAKQNAYHKAITESNSDVLFSPVYRIKTVQGLFGAKSIATVTGYGAKYANPRQVTEVVKELKKIDTTDIRKFKNVFAGKQAFTNQSNNPLRSNSPASGNTGARFLKASTSFSSFDDEDITSMMWCLEYGKNISNRLSLAFQLGFAGTQTEGYGHYYYSDYLSHSYLLYGIKGAFSFIKGRKTNLYGGLGIVGVTDLDDNSSKNEKFGSDINARILISPFAGFSYNFSRGLGVFAETGSNKTPFSIGLKLNF